MNLVQEKLDVQIKNRSNIFNWRGQFTPEFIEYILDQFATKNSIVIDPFIGSGTVLQECIRKNLTVYGGEINPAAYTMSKFFTFSNYSISDRERCIDEVTKIINDNIQPYKFYPTYDHSKTNYRESYRHLIKFQFIESC